MGLNLYLNNGLPLFLELKSRPSFLEAHPGTLALSRKDVWTKLLHGQGKTRKH